LILITVGSREYPFDRLIRQVDQLVERGIITDTVIGQIGHSTYEPKHFQWYRFLDRELFREYQAKADIIISHAGAGALVSALKLEKAVISVPRLYRYGEHIDDHQIQISGALASEGYLREVLDMEHLEDVLCETMEHPIHKKYEKPSNILSIIERKLEQWIQDGLR
jgi:UDP-N-acetylglucosamine transferase subunit ALG13